jgi:uncharacterized protein YdeI (YjbR/CyaY-like superfamily)
MNPHHPAVDAYVAKDRPWKDEIARLRAILLRGDLVEDFKWGKPCYTHDGGNVVLIMPLKASCALLFTKGALMKDPEAILIQPGENSQSARQMRFTSLAQIVQFEKILARYLDEAVQVEQAGLKVDFKKSTDLVYPPEFQQELDRNSALREAFAALTPGRQRQYHLHFTGARQSATRKSRVDKAIPLILDGLGLNDR